MAKAISISINVDLLDLTKAFKGKKGNYITLSGVLNDMPDQFENYGFVKQFVDKDSVKDMPILGNMKLKDFDQRRVATFDKLPPQMKQEVIAVNAIEVNDLDELPF